MQKGIYKNMLLEAINHHSIVKKENEHELELITSIQVKVMSNGEVYMQDPNSQEWILIDNSFHLSQDIQDNLHRFTSTSEEPIPKERWEVEHMPPKYWDNDENKRKALQWLFETKLKWNLDDIKEKVTKETFDKHGLRGMMDYFHGSPYEAVNFLYPDKIKKWELKTVGSTFWQYDENKKEALTWLFEDKLGWNVEDIKEHVTSRDFQKHGLKSLLNEHFHGSPYDAVNFLYPNKIKPWEMKRTPSAIRESSSHQLEILRWLFETKLKWTMNDIDTKLTKKTFREYRLGWLLDRFNSNPYEAVTFAYSDTEFPRLKQQYI